MTRGPATLPDKGFPKRPLPLCAKASLLFSLFGVALLLLSWTNPGGCGEKALSDHFDGTLFFNPEDRLAPAPEGAQPQRSRAGWIWRWLFRSGFPEWPQEPEASRFPPPPARVPAGLLLVTPVGHATFLIQMDGLNILTDPIWSERCSPVSWAGPKRHRRPGIAFEALPPIDAILVSHNHYDHLDLPTLEALAARGRRPGRHPPGQRRFDRRRRVRQGAGARLVAIRGPFARGDRHPHPGPPLLLPDPLGPQRGPLGGDSSSPAPRAGSSLPETRGTGPTSRRLPSAFRRSKRLSCPSRPTGRRARSSPPSLLIRRSTWVRPRRSRPAWICKPVSPWQPISGSFSSGGTASTMR